eukprot:COSAG02_NODE_1715_length_11211_cov_8.483801_8_plen_692_part_00
MAPRLALLLLFAGRANAQLSCAREEELVTNLRWLREACEQEGEAFPEGDEDTLVPSAVTAPACAEAVHRVTESCGGLLSRSPWFESRQSALAAALESASAAGLLGEGVMLGGSAQRAVMIADPDVTAIHGCGAVLEDGFEQFSQVPTGQGRVAINVGASRGNLRLVFDELTLDAKFNDNLRVYGAQNEELLAVFSGDLPLAGPIIIPGSRAELLLVSDGASSRTSLRVNVECVCEDSGRFVDLDGDGCSAYAPGGTKHGHCADLANSLTADSPALSACPLACGTCDPDPCDGAPCQNGGTCMDMRSDGATCTASDLPARFAAVSAACCDEGAEDCVPAACGAACAAVLIPFFQDCRGVLKGDLRLLATIQQAAQQCDSVPMFQCSCTGGWAGDNCELVPLPDGFAEIYVVSGCLDPARCGVFRRAVAHCTSVDSRHCPGGDLANGNTDPRMCDGAPVYQKDVADGGNDGAVLYRYLADDALNTQWQVSPSGALAYCREDGPRMERNTPPLSSPPTDSDWTAFSQGRWMEERISIASFAESYTVSGCSNPVHCGVFRRAVARCTAGRYCPGGDLANGNTDPRLCDGAPVYQKVVADGGGDGPVLYRFYNSPGGPHGSEEYTAWFVGPSNALTSCGHSYFLHSPAPRGSSGSSPTADGYYTGDGWYDEDTVPATRGMISVAVSVSWAMPEGGH